ncbi:MAG: toll/interleukin-1 receptor domain-containing protein [Candidatus Aenigmatarchaeota archaeon]
MVYNIFISYATGDEEIRNKLIVVLKENNMEPLFYDEKDVAGYDFVQYIKNLIESSQTLIAILTPIGTKSQWVNQEIGYAEKAGKDIIPLVVRGVDIKGFTERRHQIRFHVSEWSDGVSKCVDILKKRIRLPDVEVQTTSENERIRSKQSHIEKIDDDYYD